MIFKDGQLSSFYLSYIKKILQKNTENAAVEFLCTSKEHHRFQGAKARTLISDELSITLNRLQTELESSESDNVLSK